MPSFADYEERSAIKMLLIGDSGCGKTAALASLARAGYKLRIVDFDNGLDILAHLLAKDKAALNNIVYETCSDKLVAINGELTPSGPPAAFLDMQKLLTQWKMPEIKHANGSVSQAYDLGSPTTWGLNDVIVIDSLTHASNAALLYCQTMLADKNKGIEYMRAQVKITNLLTMLCGKSIACNVIVIAHVAYVESPTGLRGYPGSVGTALGPKISTFFNTCFQAKIIGTGATARRVLLTQSVGEVALKNSAPIGLAAELPQETGLADFFAHVRKNVIKTDVA